MRFTCILVVFLLSACSVSQEQTVVQPDEQFVLTDYAAIEDQPDSSRHEIDTVLQPTSLSGDVYASIGSDNEIYLVNLDNGEAAQISFDGLAKAEAVLSEKYVVWLAQQGEVTVRAPDGVDDQVLLYGIFVYNRLTGEQTEISQEPAPRMQLAIDGDRLVWADKRNELEADYTMYDIYGYDLANNKEYAIAVVPGSQQNPSIQANYVVWQDNRNSLQKDSILSGCGNCPDNRFDIYLYDFETESSQAIAEDNWLKSNPVVHDNYVVWEGYSDEFRIDSTSGGTADLYLFNIDTQSIRRLTKSNDSESSPVFFQDRLLWVVRSDCDVINIQNGKEVLPAVGVYSFDLNTGDVYRLANNKEPFVLTDQRSLLILERCSGEKAYVIRLDK